MKVYNVKDKIRRQNYYMPLVHRKRTLGVWCNKSANRHYHLQNDGAFMFHEQQKF
jgi:alpha-amylase/alpha-mannosidase (GH57 family)